MKSSPSARRRGVGLVAAVLVLSSLMAACGSSDDEAKEPASAGGNPASGECESYEEVNYILAAATVSLGSVAYTQVPEAMGYFEEECLKVNVQASGQTNSEVALSQLEVGRFDVGIPATISAVTFAAERPSIKVVFFTAFRNIGIYVPEDGDVQEPGDLAGKKLGVTSIGTGTAAYCLEAARLQGVEESDLEQVPINSGLTAVAESLRSKRLDAWCGIDSDLVAFNSAGLPSKRLESEFDEDLLPPGSMVATNDFIEKRPEVLKKFMRAVMKGYIFSLTAPEKATAIALRDYPESIPAADSKEESFDAALAIIEERMKNSPPPGYPETPIGFMPDDAIEAGVVPLAKGGLVPEDLALDEWRDLSFIEDTWASIDQAEVEQQAKDAPTVDW